MVAAMLCGYCTYGAIAEWGRLYGGELTRSLGFTREKTPSASTLFRLLSRINLRQLEELLAAWSETVLSACPVASEGKGSQGESPAGGGKAPEAIAVDGKTLRGSRRQQAPGTHLLSALSHRLGVTLGQVAVDDKTNEITAVHDLIQGLVLEGRVITMDALLTQKEIARSIREKGGTM
jgi:hypothetical protein